MIHKATPRGNRWLATSSRNISTHACIMSCAELFDETSNHPGDSAPLQPRFSALQLLAFPKTKITFERGEIQATRMGQLMVIETTVWGPKAPVLKGAEVSLSYVQHFLYLVSSSINISIFHRTWLDTFWTDLSTSRYMKTNGLATLSGKLKGFKIQQLK